MPLVRIDITGAKPEAYKRALLAGARLAVTSALGVPDSRVNIRVFEASPACVDVPACRTDRFTAVEVLLYEGRTPALKSAFISTLRDIYAENPGIEPSEVTIFFHDASVTDLSVLPGEAETH
ncbi:MAG: tautomerase family protein [Coriobacteriia bacterium]|nr:tautomerase family protein [Coriobacteriia bacterium]MBN2822859.1 tautomerase family protein [Coriobacteriia bacterium]